MRAWQASQVGDPVEVMALLQLPAPEPAAGQVAVTVTACALGYPDLLLVQGKHQMKAPLPMTPGVELAGIVRALGEGVDSVRIGDRVVGIAALPHGALADVALAPATDLHPIPDDVADVAAAAMYTAFQTAWFALHHRAALKAGETLLVHAGAGGVGSAAIQLGVAAGARVIATAGGPEKVALCRQLGAEHAIDYVADPDFAPVVNELTDGKGADVIFDPVGGEVFDRSRRCIAWEGRLVVIGFASDTIPSVKVNHVLIKNYSVMGLYWGPYRDRDPALVRRAHDEVVALVQAGTVTPLVMASYPLEQAAIALQSLSGRSTYGRLVVTP
jgi:NADPH2:quinone reductase